MIQKVVGISFNPTKNPLIVKGSTVELIHDKDNQYSSRAVAVQFDGKTIGHIGEKNNEHHEEVFNSLPITATVHTISTLAKGETFQKFQEGEITHLEIEFPIGSDISNGVHSFNEDVVIDFDPKEHEYFYNKVKLMGGTTYIKRWIKEFDKDMISGVVAKSLGVRQKEVADMWDSTGEVASLYGKSIHLALEHYEKFKDLGKIMQDKKDLEFNKALPTHPSLREIVLEFTRKFTHKDDKVLTEILVTNVERGLCGYIDRLVITGDKTARVGDYKVNINCEEEGKDKYLGQFAELPKNKLSKYQLQLSYYARLMELSGWKIEGLDVYVYEDKWKHYPMEVLKLDF